MSEHQKRGQAKELAAIARRAPSLVTQRRVRALALARWALGAKRFLQWAGLGALLRGLESALEEEHSVVLRERRPPALALTSAILVLLSLLPEGSATAGMAAALHLGFHAASPCFEALRPQQPPKSGPA